ncbi:hypothetical protein GCM10023063_17560 [Arthrobacter methylotrophus]|uniref:Uncharacterized protein n=1 Tax=Arthrobacter methylotrophus TaxID=121291 RepID=A0ABV5UPY7_9MICC
MNKHYDNAIAALRETDRLGISTEATAMAAMQTQATLAVAAEQARTNRQLELSNMIAYAQLRRARRRPSLDVEELVDVRMASAFPELGEAILPDDDEDGI